MSSIPETLATHGFERLLGPWHHETPKTPDQRLYAEVRHILRHFDPKIEYLLLTAEEDDFFFTAHLYRNGSKGTDPVLIREDDAYAVLNAAGRKPTEFSWDPSQEIKIGGETFKTAVHAIEGNNRSVILESSRFRPDGKRNGIRISIAERTAYYDTLLRDPITLPEDEVLAQPFTPLLRPLTNAG